jgi:hypothetical protein
VRRGGGPVDALGMRRKRPRTLLPPNSANFWWQFGEIYLDNFGTRFVKDHAKHQWDYLLGNYPAALAGHDVPFCRGDVLLRAMHQSPHLLLW